MRYASTIIDLLAGPATHAAFAELLADQLADDADRIERAVFIACGDGTEEAEALRRAYGTIRIALEKHANRARALPDYWQRLNVADGDLLGDAADTWEAARDACERLIMTSLKASA